MIVYKIALAEESTEDLKIFDMYQRDTLFPGKYSWTDLKYGFGERGKKSFIAELIDFVKDCGGRGLHLRFFNYGVIF